MNGNPAVSIKTSGWNRNIDSKANTIDPTI